MVKELINHQVVVVKTVWTFMKERDKHTVRQTQILTGQEKIIGILREKDGQVEPKII